MQEGPQFPETPDKLWPNEHTPTHLVKFRDDTRNHAQEPCLSGFRMGSPETCAQSSLLEEVFVNQSNLHSVPLLGS